MHRGPLYRYLGRLRLFGHQISLHLGEPFKTERTGHVGDKLVPMPHFGLVLALPDWQALAQRLQAAHTEFVLAPQVPLKASPASNGRCFCDPFGNPIEIKGFRSLDALYAS